MRVAADDEPRRRLERTQLHVHDDCLGGSVAIAEQEIRFRKDLGQVLDGCRIEGTDGDQLIVGNGVPDIVALRRESQEVIRTTRVRHLDVDTPSDECQRFDENTHVGTSEQWEHAGR
jgi:hypothetical protein